MEQQYGVKYKLVTVHLSLHQTGVDTMTAIITVRIPDYLVERLPYHQVDQIAISKAKEKLKNYMTDSESCHGSVASIIDISTAEKESFNNE